MKALARSALVVLLLTPAAPALAAEVASPPKSSAADPGDQFKAAGQNIGAAARQIGEGVKEGAERTWDAVKAGADAAQQKLSGSEAPARGSSDKDQPH